MLGLAQEVGRDMRRFGCGVREDHHLGRAGRQVHADLAEDLELGGRYPRAPGADDLVDGGHTRLGQAVGEGADGLRAAGHDELVDAEQAGRAKQDGMELALPVGGRGDHDAPDAGDPGRNHAHDERARVGRRTARDVGADAADGGPSSLDLDAGTDHRPRRSGLVRLGESPDVRDRDGERFADIGREPVASGDELRGIYGQAAVRETPAVARVPNPDGCPSRLPNVAEDGSHLLANSLVGHGAAANEPIALGGNLWPTICLGQVQAMQAQPAPRSG